LYKYIIKRLLLLIPVIFGITLLVFTIMSLAPGEPGRIILGERASEEAVYELNKKLGYYDPFFVQYFNYMKNILKGDFGNSYKSGLPVMEEILNRLPTTVILAALAMAFSTLMSVPLGVLAAVKQHSFIDNLSLVVALFLTSMPAFWLGILLILLFAIKIKWFPVMGASSLKHFILPAMTLALTNMAIDLRMTRSSMLEVMRQDYIRTARAKGVPDKIVIFKHALKNAMIPVITSIGINFGYLLGGTIITEQVFGMPGLGSLLVNAIRTKDTPLLTGAILVLALMFSLVSLTVDISYGFFDPKIKAQYQKQQRGTEYGN
jgi:peptide/nickel transport system permease protein